MVEACIVNSVLAIRIVRDVTESSTLLVSEHTVQCSEGGLTTEFCLYCSARDRVTLSP